MTATRSTREQKRYNRYQKSVNKAMCEFCTIEPSDDRFIEQTDHFIVIKNTFPYSLWDNEGVKDHLMIVPKVHRTSLAKIKDAEKIEYFDLVEKYESKGYNIYARSPHSNVKSIPHQHTHLIKPIVGFKAFVFYLHKPYVRIMK